MLGQAGLAHAFENGLELREICRVVGPRGPGGAGPRNGECRVERETGIDRGMRFVKSTELREGGGQMKISGRIISVGLDRPTKPRDRLLVDCRGGGFARPATFIHEYANVSRGLRRRASIM